jgi:hypothetical protein
MSIRTDATRQVADLYERSVCASREAWRQDSDVSAAASVSDVPALDAVRIDAAVPSVADCARRLDAARERHAQYSRDAWRNGGATGEVL